MTQLWVDDKAISVTPVLAGPCVVSQVKTVATDGYEAIQVAFGSRKVKNIKKPQQGHFKLANINPMHVREHRLSPLPEVQVGQQISLESFVENELVDVTGVSKGRGFQGVVKRHHFAGGRKTHGNKDQLRMPGSIGPKGPARVFKGTRMGGRMGGERVTVKNLNIVKIDLDNNLLFIQGGVPGAINSLLMIKTPGELKFQDFVSQEVKITEEVVVTTNQEAVDNSQSADITEDKEVKMEANSEKITEESTEPIEEIKPIEPTEPTESTETADSQPTTEEVSDEKNSTV